MNLIGEVGLGHPHCCLCSQSAHMAMVDALMMAYTVEMISIEKVVASVKRFSTFSASKELPYDLEDAMVFWVNKVSAGSHGQNGTRDTGCLLEQCEWAGCSLGARCSPRQRRGSTLLGCHAENQALAGATEAINQCAVSSSVSTTVQTEHTGVLLNVKRKGVSGV